MMLLSLLISNFIPEKNSRTGWKRINLGPKEFRILSLLMERPGQVFSRVQVLDHVWGHGIFIEDRTVDVHFSRLRKALNHRQDGSDYPDLIRTVRGSGYALKEPE